MPASIVGKADSATHAVLMANRQPLDPIFSPRSVALVGATERPGSVGRTILKNLVASPFGGVVYPINPKRRGILGIRAYPTIVDVPDPVDLAVIVTPAEAVPGVIRECVEAKVKGAIIISAGFKEIGHEGEALEHEILATARAGNLRIVGPNCLGVMNPQDGLNATFAGAMANPGSVGFVSQSGALCTAVLDWSFRVNVGFSAFVSIGSMLDVGWGDLINHLGSDPRTKSIVLYMESIGDARSFLSAAREVALTKPIIVIKAGRTEAAAKAAASHTGALTGSDEVLDAAFRRCGVIRVDQISDLFNMADILGKQPRPKGPRLTIVTNAGGPGVLATDSLIGHGGQLAGISPETMERLNGFLPGPWSHNNPIDVLGDADPDRYAKSLEVAAADPETDGMLVILTPQDMTDPTATAEQLAPYAHKLGKPVLASWMGGDVVEPGEAILNKAGMPTFAFPDTAARAFAAMWRYSDNLRSLYETPDALPRRGPGVNPAFATELIDAARAAGRTLLTEAESKQLLAAYGIPTVPTHVATSDDDAARLAAEIGYPVVLKLHSYTITHKTDVGGVQLNLTDEAAVRAAFERIAEGVEKVHGPGHFQGVTVQPMARIDGYELILGSSVDNQFGPVLLFGMGGQLVEVFKDRSLGLPPLNTTLARRMMERTKIYTALKGVRGRKPVDLDGLARLLVDFSHLVAEQPWIQEIDINPLIASETQLLALDARVLLHASDTPADKLPRLAIRPYPVQYVSRRPLQGTDGESLTIRPIRPEDEAKMRQFHATLSESTVYNRYFQSLKLSQRVAHERLTRICFNDYDREMALVAEVDPPASAGPEAPSPIVAVGRLSKRRGTSEAEFALLVSDPYQRKGVGSAVMRRLLDVARDEGLTRISGDVLAENAGMKRLCTALGFRIEPTEDPQIVTAWKEI
jgi:acetyltransferase